MVIFDNVWRKLKWTLKVLNKAKKQRKELVFHRAQFSSMTCRYISLKKSVLIVNSIYEIATKENRTVYNKHLDVAAKCSAHGAALQICKYRNWKISWSPGILIISFFSTYVFLQPTSEKFSERTFCTYPTVTVLLFASCTLFVLRFFA